MPNSSAFDRHVRIAASATGAGTLIFTVLAAPAIAEQAPSLNPFFYVPLTAMFCGIPFAMAAVARWGSVRTIYALARVHTLVSFGLLVGWVPSMISQGLPNDGAPWVLNTIAVATATAVIGWPTRVAWVLTFSYPVIGVTLRAVLLDSGWGIPIQDGVSMLSFSAIVAGLLILALSLGRRQTLELALAEQEARRAAEAESRSYARSRFGSLVHDDVITTLIAAARATVRSEDVERSARKAIARIDRFATDDLRATSVSAEIWEMEIRLSATEAVDGIQIVGSLSALQAEVPFDAAIAIIGAVREATRNSARHAGVGDAVVSRELLLQASAGSVVVELADDGCGFDPAAVAPERLGIRSSIIERVEAVPGATVSVTSARGDGATVRLEWRAP